MAYQSHLSRLQSRAGAQTQRAMNPGAQGSPARYTANMGNTIRNQWGLGRQGTGAGYGQQQAKPKPMATPGQPAAPGGGFLDQYRQRLASGHPRPGGDSMATRGQGIQTGPMAGDSPYTQRPAVQPPPTGGYDPYEQRLAVQPPSTGGYDPYTQQILERVRRPAVQPPSTGGLGQSFHVLQPGWRENAQAQPGWRQNAQAQPGWVQNAQAQPPWQQRAQAAIQQRLGGEMDHINRIQQQAQRRFESGAIDQNQYDQRMAAIMQRGRNQVGRPARQMIEQHRSQFGGPGGNAQAGPPEAPGYDDRQTLGQLNPQQAGGWENPEQSMRARAAIMGRFRGSNFMGGENRYRPGTPSPMGFGRRMGHWGANTAAWQPGRAVYGSDIR